MAVKEFDKNQLNIEAPNSQDYTLMNDDMETEDEVTTDPKMLYKRFEEMMYKDKGGKP